MARKWTTGEVQQIDLHWLDRQGMLTPGRLSPVVWSSGGQRSGAVHVLACHDRVIRKRCSRPTFRSAQAGFTVAPALAAAPRPRGGCLVELLMTASRRQSRQADVSLPFKPSKDRIAVKVINHYGDEVLKVFDVRDGE